MTPAQKHPLWILPIPREKQTHLEVAMSPMAGLHQRWKWDLHYGGELSLVNNFEQRILCIVLLVFLNSEDCAKERLPGPGRPRKRSADAAFMCYIEGVV